VNDLERVLRELARLTERMTGASKETEPESLEAKPNDRSSEKANRPRRHRKRAF
jgi:hypothetical protein